MRIPRARNKAKAGNEVTHTHTYARSFNRVNEACATKSRCCNIKKSVAWRQRCGNAAQAIAIEACHLLLQQQLSGKFHLPTVVAAAWRKVLQIKNIYCCCCLLHLLLTLRSLCVVLERKAQARAHSLNHHNVPTWQHTRSSNK